MKHLAIAILTLTVMFSTACSTQEIKTAADAYAVVNTAVEAESLLGQFLDGDAEALEAIDQPLKNLSKLAEDLKKQDLDADLVQFLLENTLITKAFVRDWQKIIDVVGEYSKRTQKTIPPALVAYRMDVEMTYAALRARGAEAFTTGQDGPPIGEYLGIVLKVLAASQGVIL